MNYQKYSLWSTSIQHYPVLHSEQHLTRLSRLQHFTSYVVSPLHTYNTQSLDTDMQRLFYSTWPPSFSSHIKKFLIGEESDGGHWIKRALYICIKRLWYNTMYIDPLLHTYPKSMIPIPLHTSSYVNTRYKKYLLQKINGETLEKRQSTEQGWVYIQCYVQDFPAELGSPGVTRQDICNDHNKF